MKLKYLYVVLSVLMLCACNKQVENNNVINKENEQQIADRIIFVERTEEKKKLNIPDPRSYNVNEKIILPDESMLSKEKNIYVDMSFLGFTEETELVAWGSGKVLELQLETKDIKYMFDENSEELLGNCIILSITDKKDQNYLILLDYINGRCYTTNTKLQLTSKKTKRPEIKFADLTSDGLEEIILTNVPYGYKSGTICEIYRFDRSGDELKNIYKEKGDYLSGTLEQEYFKCELKDNYKVVVKCDEIDYSETINLLDIGFKIKDMEIKYKPKDDMDGCYFYKDGSVIEKDRVHISNKKEDKGVLLVEDKTKGKRIHFKYVLFLERWHNVGEIDAQLYYDKSDDHMEIETVAIDLDRP